MRFAVLLATVAPLVACKKHEDPGAPPLPIPAPKAAADDVKVDLARLGALPMADRTGSAATPSPAMHEVTVMSFWASWCHPCLEELPLLDKLARENEDPRVGFVAVNVDEANDHAAAVKVLDEKHITLPVLFDPDAAAYQMLFPEAGADMVSIPALALVKHDRVVWRDDGFNPDPDAFSSNLRDHIAAAVKP